MRSSIANRTLLAWSAISAFAAGSILFQNTTIATWNDDLQAVQVIRSASLLIENDKISKIYNASDSVPANITEVFDGSNKIIVPGFVNTHHHMWQTLYKTLLPNTPFAAYFPRLGHMAPISQTLTVDDVYRSELMGAMELMSEGTTSWIDITGVLSPGTVDAGFRANLASGGRSFFAATLQPKPSFSEEDQIGQIRNLTIRPELLSQSLVSVGLSYDVFDGASEESRERVLDLIHTTNLSFITTHYVGGPFANANSPALLNSSEWSLLNGSLPIIFSHSSYLSPLDAALLRENNQYISTAPESEQHFGHGNPQLHRIQDQASIGADTPLAYSTSIIGQARMWLQQLRGRLQQQQINNWIINTNSPMSVNQAFYLATRAGALSLRRSDLGIITPGAKADLVVYDTNRPNLIGWRDPVAAVMLHSNAGDIQDVIIDGKFVKKNFALTYANFTQLRADFESSARTFEARYRNWTFPAEVPEYFGLGVYGQALEVDVVPGNATGY